MQASSCNAEGCNLLPEYKVSPSDALKEIAVGPTLEPPVALMPNEPKPVELKAPVLALEEPP